MQKVTESDLEKVRKYVSIMKSPLPELKTGQDPYSVREQAYVEAKAAAIFLIDYYYTVVEPDNGEFVVGYRPYESTKTQLAYYAITNGRYAGGSQGDVFIRKYPDLLEKAIVHYKAAAKDRLDAALSTSLTSLTGSQLLILLQEHERRSSDGYPLMMPSKENSNRVTYKNPYDVLADIHKTSELLPNSDGSQLDTDSDELEGTNV